MVKFTGEKASITFGSTTYHCLTRQTHSATVNEERIDCSASGGLNTEYIDIDTENIHYFDIYVEVNAHATLSAFAEGTTEATFEVHPEGDTAGNIEISYASGGKVLSRDWNVDATTPFILSVSIRGIGTKTEGAAS